jgi:two-component system OmpR family sensor kinase
MRGRRLYARTPLRVRLVAAVLLIVVAALVGAGAAATATMRAYLVSRVDSQLQAVAQHPTAQSATATDRAATATRAGPDCPAPMSSRCSTPPARPSTDRRAT